MADGARELSACRRRQKLRAVAALAPPPLHFAGSSLTFLSQLPSSLLAFELVAHTGASSLAFSLSLSRSTKKSVCTRAPRAAPPQSLFARTTSCTTKTLTTTLHRHSSLAIAFVLLPLGAGTKNALALSFPRFPLLD